MWIGMYRYTFFKKIQKRRVTAREEENKRGHSEVTEGKNVNKNYISLSTECEYGNTCLH